jgi:ABC-type multidrug transport system ATPase subunit
MPIELKKEHDRNAQSFFKVAFVNNPDEPIGDILSEGEHRCVALAAFLAELVTSNEYSGIVFDDPMSSLDHIYRQNVAKRLVEEAEHRQVVVFTHDLTFLFDVSNQSTKQNREISYQTVRRVSNVPGYVESDLPFKAKQSGPMENSIRSFLKSLKGNFDAKPETERSVIAKGVIAEIRIAWEQGIADFIGPVLARFDRGVKPNSLYKFLVLDKDDVKAVQDARSRLSEDVHAAPETLNPAGVEHQDLVDELNKLQKWLHNINAKQKAAREPT